MTCAESLCLILQNQHKKYCLVVDGNSGCINFITTLINNLTTIVQIACITLLLITNNIASAQVHTTPHQYTTERNLTTLVNENGDQHQFFYDGNERLIEENGFDGRTQHYQYNAAGHLIQYLDNGEVITEIDRNALGQLETKTSRRIGDAADNIERSRYRYDAVGQLLETYNAQHFLQFSYDPLERRIQKTDKFGTTSFLWTDNLLAQETRNHIKKTYVFEPGSFRPLAQVQDNKVYHYHLDHLGTPRELTNDEGKIVWKAKYKTYGNIALKEVEEVENNLRFQGQYFDEETGLHYNRFRYYSPDTGQFINQDPIGLLGGLNNYQYAPNPIAWIDPLGLCKEHENIANKTPDFIVSPGGTVFPVPKGATGPTPVINPTGNQTGIAFTGGTGGANGQVTTMRIMDPTLPKGSSPGYPGGYIKYENFALPKPQGVDPYTGKTLPNALSHFSID